MDLKPRRIKTAIMKTAAMFALVLAFVLASFGSKPTGGDIDQAIIAAQATVAGPVETAAAVESAATGTTALPIPPPTIHGVREIHVGRYGAVAYRAGVTVTDSAGQATLTVDSSRGSTDIPGAYEVVYIAASTSGRVTRNTTRVVVSGATQEAVAELTIPVLEQLLHEEMGDEEKARAIFDWIRTNITYSATGERDGVLDGAYRGITLRQGDCYTFYALAKVLFEQAGIETIGLERVLARTEHFWLLLNIGGDWYHVDPTPLLHPAPGGGFMMTESQIANYDPFQWGFYYKYDPALLPYGVYPV